ncbi:C39 family peptidase [Luteolibacter flavescens]|uniref:C39 family peptidase n=1 Tax=Luteolibacter flavescens TaxID=1859460 RepID=A0ABT3FKR5_9BACT|nr:C39 family peptidase [Luteolibacter flavescens]MCW1884162.1 C39 family peptidase [Luteolibacter flavescens]
MKSMLVCLPLALSLNLHAAIGEWRVLKDGEGGSIRARFEGIKSERYLLRRESDGKLFEVAPGMLQGEDRTSFDKQAWALSDELRKLDKMAGHKLFSGTPFEVRNANEIASALGLGQESKTSHSASWRNYTGDSYRLFGARPYSVALYADQDGNASVLSAVYSNKGDFKSGVGQGESHFEGKSTADAESLAKAMDADEKAVLSAITGALGQPTSQRFGDSRATRRKVSRWDWNGHSLILSSQEGEYVSLSIVPLELADAGGKTAKVRDGDLRKRMLNDVVKESNGDVYLGQIPMVNQGPKGYCVPATFERAMRAAGIEADMYLLAMVGKSGMGGGTSVEFLLEEVRQQVRSKGRRTKDERVKELRVRDVKRYIDQGVPVMWTMRSLEGYNKIANANTSKRKSIKDWTKWTQDIAVETEALLKTESINDNHHICMIVGYNEATNELAVSDSWGASYERRWVPAPVANWASSGGLFMILP